MANKVLHVHDGLLGYVPRAGVSAFATGAAMSAVHGLAIAGEKGPAAKVLQKNHKTWLADAARLPGGRAIVYLRRIFVLGRPQS
jgi:hypothetical protein